jgi:histidinol-phosphate/aromatic aminotransferase/cobyric acid decarboxylase-like protein
MSLRVHGDALVAPESLDFAVNIWPGTQSPALGRALHGALDRAGYPDGNAAREAAARRHGRSPEDVLLLNGACEAFWLLAFALRPRLAACIHPGFTEPEAAMRASGAEVARVMREPGTWRLDPASVPDDAEVVILGNPENPVGALEEPATLRRLLRHGRIVVVDESFLEFVPGEPQTVSGDGEFVVVRSLTKLWSLAGVRAGYLLAPAPIVGVLEAARQPWSVNAAACAAIKTCSEDADTPAAVAGEVERERRHLAEALARLPLVEAVWPSPANFVLLKTRGGATEALRAAGISVRPCGSFPGLTDDYIRVAVRGRVDNDRLVEALR